MPDIIIITIANYYPRLNKFYSSDEMSKLLSFLSTYPINSKIVYQDLDIGPVVKIKSALDYWTKLKDDTPKGNRNEKEDVIIIVDDDSGLYEKSIELLTESYINNGDAIYGIMGKIGKDIYVHGEFVKDGEYRSVDLLGGYRGVLYPIHLLLKKKELMFNDWLDMFLKDFSCHPVG